jgi:MGT family glycosyltransferase
MTNVFAGSAAQRMVPDLLAICDAWQPDVIARDQMEFGACVAAERRGLPHATISVGFFFPAGMWQFLAQDLASLRSTYGLPPDPDLNMLYRYLYLAFMPPRYQLPGIPLAPVVHSLRPTAFDRSGDERLPDWISHLPDQPTVHVTLGTVFNRAPDVLAVIIEGLGGLPLNVIVSTGRNQDPAILGPPPANVHLERYIPQTLLYPHCDLVVTHGGFNTVMCALSHGLPLLVVPLSADQALHAMRCADLGLGIAIAPGDLSPRAVGQAVGDLLSVTGYREHVERMRGEMEVLPGVERAVELIEALAARGA